MGKRAKNEKRRREQVEHNPHQSDDRRNVSCFGCGEEFRVSNNYTGDRPYCRDCRSRMPRGTWQGE